MNLRREIIILEHLREISVKKHIYRYWEDPLREERERKRVGEERERGQGERGEERERKREGEEKEGGQGERGEERERERGRGRERI